MSRGRTSAALEARRHARHLEVDLLEALRGHSYSIGTTRPLSGLLVSLGNSSSALADTKGGTITMVGSSTNHDYDVTVTYSTDGDGNQPGQISIYVDGNKPGTTHKFKKMSFTCDDLEASWGENGGGITITFRPIGNPAGNLTPGGGMGQVPIKKK